MKSSEISDAFLGLVVGSAQANVAAPDRLAIDSPNASERFMPIAGAIRWQTFISACDIKRQDHVKGRTEVFDMPAVKSTGKAVANTKTKLASRKATEVLLHGRKGDTRMKIIKYTQEGFDLSDVREMVSTSELYMERSLVERITGKSVRTVQRLAKEAEPMRLDQQQSTIAYQYAQSLEHAVSVFGNLQLAENWLKKPCKYLDGHIPLELIVSSLGYQEIEEYLTRVEHGVYQ